MPVPGGWIVFNDPRTQLNAHCDNKDHGRCHFDKNALASARRARRGQGRPLGALALWLSCGDCASKAEHAELKKWVCSRATREGRIHYRDSLRFLPGAEELLNGEEFPQDLGSDSEPECIPN